MILRNNTFRQFRPSVSRCVLSGVGLTMWYFIISTMSHCVRTYCHELSSPARFASSEERTRWSVSRPSSVYQQRQSGSDEPRTIWRETTQSSTSGLTWTAWRILGRTKQRESVSRVLYTHHGRILWGKSMVGQKPPVAPLWGSWGIWKESRGNVRLVRT